MTADWATSEQPESPPIKHASANAHSRSGFLIDGFQGRDPPPCPQIPF